MTSNLMIRLRRFTRKLGLNRLIGSLFASRRYEDLFGSALLAEVRQGDIVWDIGANLGLYTEQFLSCVGANGAVCAFEPVPACFDQLLERFNPASQVKLMNIAVGVEDGQISMEINDDPLASTHRVISTQHSGRGVEVSIRSASSLVRSGDAAFPNLVKIDVEGHEGAVMYGMQDLLSDSRLRCIGIEVHFGLLDERGEGARPKQIEQSLLQHGFRVRWTDPSHLIAVR